MQVTIKDIAKAAGVSRGTVDRALNNRDGINPDVAVRIKDIASNLGYKPNILAKALASRSNPIHIAVLINSLNNPFFDKVLDGINSAFTVLADYGIVTIIIKLQGYDKDRQLEELTKLSAAGIDGLVITPVSDEAIRMKLNEMSEQGIQIVCCNLDIDDVAYQAYVGCDYFCSGQTAGEVIGLTTHRECSLGVITSSHELYWHEMRIRGCKSVLKNYPHIHLNHYIEASDDDEICYRKVKRLLCETGNIDTLYFVAAGTTGGLQAIRDLNQEERIRVYTFDQIPAVIEGLKSGLIVATIDQQPFIQGEASVRYLFDTVINKQAPSRQRIITELNIRTRYNMTA